MSLIDHIVVLLFAVAYPIYSFLSYPNSKQALLSNKPGERVRLYRETIIWLWAFCILVLAVQVYQGRSFEDIGFVLSSHWTFWTALSVTLLAAAFFYYQHQTVQRDAAQVHLLQEQLGKSGVSELLPRTAQETRWFLSVSITAGICEEILFRGYLIWYFAVYSSTAPAVIFSTILFGLAHGYLGWKLGVRSGLTGLVLALTYVFSGSLLVPVLLHIMVDISTGMLGQLALSERS